LSSTSFLYQASQLKVDIIVFTSTVQESFLSIFSPRSKLVTTNSSRAQWYSLRPVILVFNLSHAGIRKLIATLFLHFIFIHLFCHLIYYSGVKVARSFLPLNHIHSRVFQDLWYKLREMNPHIETRKKVHMNTRPIMRIFGARRPQRRPKLNFKAIYFKY